MLTVVRKHARPNRLEPTEARVLNWHLMVEVGTTLEEVTEPTYWANVIHCLKPGHRITIEVQDYTWIAEFIVRWAHGTRADLHLLQHHEINAAEGAPKLTDPEFADFDVVWGGTGDQYRVVRKSDNIILKKNLASIDDGSEWLGEYLGLTA